MDDMKRLLLGSPSPSLADHRAALYVLGILLTKASAPAVATETLDGGHPDACLLSIWCGSR